MRIQAIKQKTSAGEPYLSPSQALRACKLDRSLNLLEAANARFLARVLAVTETKWGNNATVEFAILCRVAPEIAPSRPGRWPRNLDGSSRPKTPHPDYDPATRTYRQRPVKC